MSDDDDVMAVKLGATVRHRYSAQRMVVASLYGEGNAYATCTWTDEAGIKRRRAYRVAELAPCLSQACVDAFTNAHRSTQERRPLTFAAIQVKLGDAVKCTPISYPKWPTDPEIVEDEDEP